MKMGKKHQKSNWVIVFDLGGVLFNKGKSLFIKKLAREIHTPVRDVKKVIDGDMGEKYRKAQVGKKEYWRFVIKRLTLDGKYSASNLERFWFDQYVIDKNVEDILKRLQHSRFCIYCLSNNFPERVNYLNSKYKFKKYFDKLIFSYRHKSLKSGHRIYRSILSDGFQKVIVIDDRKENLAYPKKIGFKTIKYDNASKLKKDLKKQGVQL